MGRWSPFPRSEHHGQYIAFPVRCVEPGTQGHQRCRRHLREGPADPHTTGRVSLSNLGAAQGNDESFAPAISADGRYVSFGSVASNLISGDTNSEGDIFVRDRQKHTTRRINVSSTATPRPPPLALSR